MKSKIWVALYPVFYRVFYVLLLAGVTIKGFGAQLGIRNIGGWHWLTVGILVFLLAWLNYGTMKGKVVSFAMLLLFVWIMIPFIGAGSLDGFWRNYYHWILLRTDFEETWVVGYELVQVLWVVFGCYLFHILSTKSRWIKELSAVALIVVLLICMFADIEIPQVGVALIICYIMICVVERVRINWNKEKSQDKQGYIIWLAPFFALYVLMICLFPVKEEPYDWKFVKRIYNNIHEKFVVWYEDFNRNGREEFGTFIIGFSDNTELVEGVQKDQKEVMQIKGAFSLATNMYLAGKCYDTFDGREWEQTVEGNTGEFPIDSLEILYAAEKYDAKYVANYVRSTRISLTYEKFDTGYLFVPLKPTYIHNTDYEINGREFKFGEQRGYGTTYDISYLQMNLHTEEFATFLKAQHVDDKKVWKNIVARYAPENMKGLTWEDLAAYRQCMISSYSKQIVLSDEVQKYLQKITAGCESSYDKLKAIEQELASYHYTITPGKLPKDIDTPEEFLDFFLLESRQGYCAYFASAFVLLAQAEGLPARYTEGFCVPSNFAKGETTVYSNMAHAWPEVYMEGVGWVPFEPTPGYSAIRYKGWEARKYEDTVTVTPAPDVTPMPSPSPLPLDEPQEAEAQVRILDRVFLICKVLGITFSVLFMVLLAEKIRIKRNYARMSLEQKFEVEVNRNLWLFARLDCKRMESETLGELQVRIRETLPELMADREAWKFIINYEEYLYGSAQVSKEVLQECITERQNVLAWIKQERQGYYYLIKVWLYFSM